MQLLENDNESNDDIIDIFEQYNSEDTTDDVSEDTQDIPENLTRPKADNHEDKGWEDNFIKNDDNIKNKSIKEFSEDESVSTKKEEEKLQLDTSSVDNTKKWEQKYENDEFKINSAMDESEENFNNQEIENPIVLDEMQSDNKELTADEPKEEIPISSITIKKSKQQSEPKKIIPKQEIQMDTNKKTIMIVDDDIDTLEMYADVFRAADYNVIRAFDGLEALSLLGDHIPDVIFTGIVMPRMDGFTMLESIKKNERTANIPVVINSHLGRDTDKGRAKELGARDFIIRGFTQPKEVLERVGALLLKSEYTFHFNPNDKDVQRLAKDLGTSDFLKCPHGQDMVLKLSIEDEKNLTFSARFSCIDNVK